VRPVKRSGASPDGGAHFVRTSAIERDTATRVPELSTRGAIFSSNSLRDKLSVPTNPDGLRPVAAFRLGSGSAVSGHRNPKKSRFPAASDDCHTLLVPAIDWPSPRRVRQHQVRAGPTMSDARGTVALRIAKSARPRPGTLRWTVIDKLRCAAGFSAVCSSALVDRLASAEVPSADALIDRRVRPCIRSRVPNHSS